MEDQTLIKLSAIWGLVVLMVVDALTWKVDHVLWSLSIAAISGLAGYQVGVSKRTDKG